MTLLGRLVQDGVDLNDESNHHNDRSKRKSQKAEAVPFIFECHDEKSGDERYDADDHPLIVLFAEGKFIHNC